MLNIIINIYKYVNFIYKLIRNYYKVMTLNADKSLSTKKSF